MGDGGGVLDLGLGPVSGGQQQQDGLQICFRAGERYDGCYQVHIPAQYDSESDPELAAALLGAEFIAARERARQQRARDGFAPHAPTLRPDFGPNARGVAVRTTAWDPTSPVHWVQTVPRVEVEFLPR